MWSEKCVKETAIETAGQEDFKSVLDRVFSKWTLFEQDSREQIRLKVDAAGLMDNSLVYAELKSVNGTYPCLWLETKAVSLVSDKKKVGWALAPSQVRKCILVYRMTESVHVYDMIALKDWFREKYRDYQTDMIYDTTLNQLMFGKLVPLSDVIQFCIDSKEGL